MDDLDGVRCHDSDCPRSRSCARWTQFSSALRNLKTLRDPGQECQAFVDYNIDLEQLEVESRR